MPPGIIPESSSYFLYNPRRCNASVNICFLMALCLGLLAGFVSRRSLMKYGLDFSGRNWDLIIWPCECFVSVTRCCSVTTYLRM
ncbi:hypothetical protein GDO78_004815 [Eleutherodactylus coqui]|uniref:Uncharacterized protein n=1 Tax=Eleutherodactylus coqui TaxID=57060 RepID=A0A8J6FJ10_ELECQ|nr:hypothetical protein GDO78_004815 [Eleutherodactylus coqui]